MKDSIALLVTLLIILALFTITSHYILAIIISLLLIFGDFSSIDEKETS